MVSIKEVLSKVSKGRSVTEISKHFNIRESTLRAMLEFIAEKGYLEEVSYGGGCERCLINRQCNMPASGDRKIKMYTLTKEGMKYIREASEVTQENKSTRVVYPLS